METQRVKKRAFKVLGAALTLTLLGAALAVYWFERGRLELSGRVRTDLAVVAAATQGRVSGVAVRAGERVARGQILVRIDEEARRNALVQAQEQLSLLAQMLPTQYRPAPGADRDETLDQRHERRQREEEAARRRLQEASDREAEASVYYSRVAMMAARREATETDRAAAEGRLAAARAEKERAREDFEAFSLSRAASGADIRRVRDAQRASGASELPVDIRLDRYRQQEERVYIAARALEDALVRAPADGVVVELLAGPGAEARPGTPVALLRPDGSAPTVVAAVSAAERQRLKAGMRCSVVVGDETRDGYIAGLRPQEAEEGSGEAAFRAVVSLLPGNGTDQVGTPGSLTPFMEDAAGLDAVVTVLLREPLYATAAHEQGAGAPAQAIPAQIERDGQAAVPGAPLSVQTPFGPDARQPSDPDAQQSNPDTPQEAAGRGAPLLPQREAAPLPPMEAPYPLKGSPLPDPANNPSVVRGDILDNAATAPR